MQYKHVKKHVKFKEFNFKLLVASELEILSVEDLSTEEKTRTSKVTYKDIYEFEGFKAYYAAWLRDIESCIKMV